MRQQASLQILFVVGPRPVQVAFLRIIGSGIDGKRRLSTEARSLP